MMKIKFAISSFLVLLFVILAMPALADSGTKVIEGKQGRWFMDTQGAVISDNLVVLLDPFFIQLPNSHKEEANQGYEIRIVATHWNRDKMNFEKGKYKSLSYETATIEIEGDVKKEFFYFNPLGTNNNPDNLAGNGLAFIQVKATTSVDKRSPSVEKRHFAIIIHLKNVKGKQWNGETVFIGNVDAVFKDSFTFYHNPTKMPDVIICGGTGGGTCVGSSRDPEKIGTETFGDGPTPQPEGSGWKIFGEDSNNRQEERSDTINPIGSNTQDTTEFT